MTAKEAKKLSDESLNQVSFNMCGEIFTAIKTAAEKGEYETIFHLKSQHHAYVDRMSEWLISMEYEIDHKQGYDQRDGDSWNYLFISWK